MEASPHGRSILIFPWAVRNRRVGASRVEEILLQSCHLPLAFQLPQISPVFAIHSVWLWCISNRCVCFGRSWRSIV